MAYTKSSHKKAFLLWYNGWSKRKIGKQPQLPSRRQIIEWSKENYSCDCPYHGWPSLKTMIDQQRQEELEKKGVDLEDLNIDIPEKDTGVPVSYDSETGEVVNFQSDLNWRQKIDRLEELAWYQVVEKGMVPDNFSQTLQLLQLIASEKSQYLEPDFFDVDEEEEYEVIMKKAARGD